jgi:hypothetical protein
MFKHEPQHARFGHSLAPGQAGDGRMEALHLRGNTGSSRGPPGHGHLVISCGNRHDELRSTTFYEPPHDIRHRHAGQGCRIRPVATTTAVP